MKIVLPLQLQQDLEELSEKTGKTPEQLGIELLQDIVDSVFDDETLLGRADE